MKRNIFPFLEAVYGVTGTLQKHAKSKQLLKRDERAIQEATGAYTDRKVMSIGDEKGIAGLSGGCVKGLREYCRTYNECVQGLTGGA